MLSVIVPFAVFWISNYSHAYGYGDDEGITFRRYFRKYRITWDDVDRVDWTMMQTPYVFLTLERPVGFFRTVKFASFRPRSKPGEAQNPDWVPEILPWMMNQLRMNQPPST